MKAPAWAHQIPTLFAQRVGSSKKEKFPLPSRQELQSYQRQILQELSSLAVLADQLSRLIICSEEEEKARDS